MSTRATKDRAPGRGKLDENVSSKAAEPPSLNPDDKTPRQRLQAAEPPNPKDWQSLLQTAAVHSGLIQAGGAPFSARSVTPASDDSAPPPPCKISQEAWQALILNALSCACGECMHMLDHAGMAYDGWRTSQKK